MERAKTQFENAKRDLNSIKSNRQRIIRDYLEPYKRDIDDTEREYDELLDNRSGIIENYIAPYKRKVRTAKKSLQVIQSMHEANF